ncbi:D-alanine--D-alanine ligase [Psilocybe cubensis]|uniref:D-alanine--D-alanine ligase n=1 Tax=Psilocybe cubensis TaxID=181762 RepID=A0ACB8GFM3_PSICU|nr:D-alanine--D-alanine ligase [Psilocybe cubensis]KAH9474398.1 D-alanine--D-alanine ligase [Psilocybe cubensis]
MPTPVLKIAFTYDSREEWLALGYSAEQCAEFDFDETIQRIAASLRKLGTVEMIGGLKALTKVLVKSKPDWDIVFNICEGFGGVGREAQVPALLEAWGIPFTFSDSATLGLCLDKAKTKMVLEHYGVPSAPYACVPPRNAWSKAAEMSVESVIQSSPHSQALKTFPLFAKPSAEGSGVGIQQANKVTDYEQLAKVVEDLSLRYPTQTILIERFLSGREFTVGILGTGSNARAIGVREIVFLKDNPNCPIDPATIVDNQDPELLELEVYSNSVKRAGAGANPQHVNMDLSSNPVAQRAAEVAVKAWKVLGCRDGGRVDIRYDSKDANAVPNCIEVNPLAGLRPGYSDFPLLAESIGIDYDQLISTIVHSALERSRLTAN